MHCKPLQCTVNHCNALHQTAPDYTSTPHATSGVASDSKPLQCTARNCTTLQCTATHCMKLSKYHIPPTLQHIPPTLQHIAKRYTTLHYARSTPHTTSGAATRYTPLQRTATHCHKLRRTARKHSAYHLEHCNILQSTAAHCNQLHHTATHCKVHSAH